jgi:hypothetical protein
MASGLEQLWPRTFARIETNEDVVVTAISANTLEVGPPPVLRNSPRRAIESPSRRNSLEIVLMMKATENRLADDAMAVRDPMLR